jgi:DNA invertase Pin-like site-specific DNA recombinase
MQQAVRDALIGVMAATAQAQAEATKAAQRAGIEHAKQNDQRTYLGRKPSFTREQLEEVRFMLSADRGYRSDRQGDRPDPADGVPDQG